MLNQNTDCLILLRNYLGCLFVVGLFSLSLSNVLNSRKPTEPQINLEKTASLALKDAEHSR